jgi:hypothetical protein
MMRKRKHNERNYLKLRGGGSNLDFGRLVAEQDTQLAEYYVLPERFVVRATDVYDPATFFVGPKGVGKSAVLQMVRLNKSSEDRRIINIGPDDLAFSALANAQAHSSILSDADKNQWLFKVLWDFVLSLEIFRREYSDQTLVEQFLAKFTRGSHEKDARKLLDMSSGEGHKSLTARIIQLIDEVEVSGEAAGVKVAVKGKVDRSSPSKAESFSLLSFVNSLAKQIADNLRHPYIVLIDDLDLHWRDTPTQNSFIAALFVSLRHFNRPPNLKCVVAMRNNIYDRLPIVDRDKFHDWVCPVRWDHEAVRKMIEDRAVFKLMVHKTDVWGGVFPERAFDVIWNHSNGRPREAIRLATLCASEALHQGHSRVTDDDMATGVRVFSDERIREFSTELQYQYPNMEPFLRRFSGWPKEFGFEKVRELAEYIELELEADIEYVANYPWMQGFGSKPIALARFLLECNVFWLKRSRTDVAAPYDPRSSGDVTPDNWFAIHPMFGPGLGLSGA